MCQLGQHNTQRVCSPIVHLCAGNIWKPGVTIFERHQVNAATVSPPTQPLQCPIPGRQVDLRVSSRTRDVHSEATVRPAAGHLPGDRRLRRAGRRDSAEKFDRHRRGVSEIPPAPAGPDGRLLY
uniref:Uncharacterized protein n=1 Tax=Cacopsylla melanoneura TaxID=428564 RepID=A0A8D9BSD0_9HEMI